MTISALTVLSLHLCKLPSKVIRKTFRIFENLKMRGLWFLYYQLLIVKIVTISKILTYVIRYLTTMHPERKSTYAGIINLSWLRRYLKLSWKEHVSETNFQKIQLIKISKLKERNLFLAPLRKEKKEYFANLTEKDITENRIRLNLEKI